MAVKHDTLLGSQVAGKCKGDWGVLLWRRGGRLCPGRGLIVLRRTRSRFGENAADSKISNNKTEALSVSKLSVSASVLLFET